MFKKKNKIYIALMLMLSLLMLDKNIFSNDFISNNRKKIIVDNLKPQIKYKVNNNVDLFKKILIGCWGAPPHANYIFLEDGTFITNNVDLDYKNKVGYWFLKNDYIYLKLKDDEKWNVIKIDYYLLEIGEDMLGNKLNYYNLYVVFADSIKWDNVRELILQFE